jgi:hypothetical protein
MGGKRMSDENRNARIRKARRLLHHGSSVPQVARATGLPVKVVSRLAQRYVNWKKLREEF